MKMEIGDAGTSCINVPKNFLTQEKENVPSLT